MKRIALLYLAALLLGGCAHTYRVAPNASPMTLMAINTRLQALPGKIVLQDGDTLHGARFQVQGDSTLWFQGKAGERRVFPNRDIQYIAAIKRDPLPWQGLKDGALYGGAIGGLLGLGIGVFIAALPEPYEQDYAPIPPDSLHPWPYGHGDPDDGREWAPLYGALIGVATGATVGSFLGVFIEMQLGQPIQVNFRYPLDRPRRASSARF